MKLVFKSSQPVRVKTGSIASIDPGLGGTGYAIWSASDWNRLVPPKHSGVVNCRIDLDWPDAVAEIGYQMGNILKLHAVHDVFVELPQVMHSQAGLAASASGDLVKLCMVAGCVIGSLNPSWSRVFMVSIPKWKGQLSKTEVANRIKQRLPTYRWSVPNPTSHEVDAVGIGLYAKGHL